MQGGRSELPWDYLQSAWCSLVVYKVYDRPLTSWLEEEEGVEVYCS